ncbi:MAG: hypothetical protein HC800_21060, partial [Phormidesmis sp. RL_2_1]|nr:hypothetical protein [Phormidesmis sp. RL_2_1]
MIHPANETFGQARQGSVAAIIQVLNERLADMGIRTRAVVADGVLQLLCEAPTLGQLEKTKVVERVRHELEAISPHRIKRVKINSRIVKEEQLLWFEEINRDPENALLWDELITLKRPFFIQRWIRDRDLKPAGPIFTDITQPPPDHNTLSSKILAAAGLTLLMLGTLWLFREDLSQIREVAKTNPPSVNDTILEENDSGLSGDRTADTTPIEPPATASPTTNSTATTSNTSGTVADAFAEAVRIAEAAANDGQVASTAAEWLDLAARWQRASD